MRANCMRLGSIEAMHNGLVALGVILLLIGLFASFACAYPYQNLGMILIIVGVFLVVVGVLYPHRKEEVHTQEELYREALKGLTSMHAFAKSSKKSLNVVLVC